MMRFLLITLFLASLPGGMIVPAAAGTITGTVSATGKQIPGGAKAGGKYESRRYAFAETMEYDQEHEFIVYIDQPIPDAAPPPTTAVQVVVQQNATFSPRILPVQAGTTVEWPNKDSIFHNVFSFSEAEPFDLGLYKDEIKEVTFDTPGRVDVYCSIHKNMQCIVLVLENPHFAATDRKGRFTIEDVPAGTYRVKAWHERLPPLVIEVEVPETGEVVVDFELGVTGLPTY